MNKVKEILEKHDRPVSYLVRMTRISRYTLDKIVKNEKSPSIDELMEISNALNEDIKIFFESNTSTINIDNNNKNKNKESGKVK